MSSWHTWNILKNRAGNIGPSNSKHHEIDTVRLMRGNSRVPPRPCLLVQNIFRLLMSLIGLLRVLGVNLLIVFIFYVASAKLPEVNLVERGR